MTTDTKSELHIGWASRDVTPDRPVLLRGQFYARVSEGVMDPITVTALALESVRGGETAERAIMVSCDFVSIPDELRDAVRAKVAELLPELDPSCVCLNATHTHTAPETREERSKKLQAIGSLPAGESLAPDGLGVMPAADYAAFVVKRVAAAVVEAWKAREPGGIGFGLGHAVVGHNRRVSYFNGETRMYGKTDDPEFSHIEGGTDHSVNVLCTWNRKEKLTGMVVNLACPSQTSEHEFQVSADYWHETRIELRRRLGDDLFVLPQCSAGGDQSPHVQVDKPAEQRMLRLAGRTQREDIAVRIADAVTTVVPFIKREIDWSPELAHRVEVLELPLRKLEESDVAAAEIEAEKARETYEAMIADLRAHPEKREEPRWYVKVTTAYNRMLWNSRVGTRFEEQQTRDRLPVEIHVLRLGDAAFATNPFEYYLDFALQIKARSRAVQTFVAQLAGGGSYLPTVRATTGKSYGAVPASTPFGPEAGRMLAQRTIEIIAELVGDS